MSLTSAELDQLLQTLLDSAVSEATFHPDGSLAGVKFIAAAAPVESVKDDVTYADPRRNEKAAQATSQWRHPALWGASGKPPSFKDE